MARKYEVGGIPFGRSVDFEGFKLYRSKHGGVECLNVSMNGGSWHVRVPSTVELFGMLLAGYKAYCIEDGAAREHYGRFLTTVLHNIVYVSTVCNGYFHQGVSMVATAYANPDLLSDKKKRKGFLGDVGQVVERFLAWRKEFDASMAVDDVSEEELLREDELVEQSVDALSSDE